MNSFLTLLKKELRENALWAGLLSIPLLLALILSLRGYIFDNKFPIFGSSFALVTLIGFPLLAGALGLLQTLFESRGDKWAFLIHRPVSTAMLLSAKLIAGFFLYFIVSFLSLVLAMLWISRPGMVGMPFSWLMSLPAVACVFAGGLYLPVAMAIGLRQSRSHLLRALPVGLPILASSLTARAFEFHHAILISTAFYIPALLLLRHAFFSNLASTSSALGRKTEQAATAFAILASLWLLALTVFWISLNFNTGRGHSERSYYILDKHAGVLRSILIDDKNRFTDAFGGPLPDSPDALSYLNLRPPNYASLHTFDNYDELWGLQTPYTRANRYAVRLEHHNGGSYWFLIPGTGRIVGFPHDNTRLGSFGPQGFDKSPDPSRPGFGGRFILAHLVAPDSALRRVCFSSGAYLLDLGHLTLLKAIFIPRPGETILATGPGIVSYGDVQPPSQFLILTDQRLLFFDSQSSNLVSQIPIPPFPPNISVAYGRLTIIGNTLNILLEPNSHDTSSSFLFLSFDLTSGKILQTQILPRLNPEKRWLPHYEKWGALLMGPAAITAITSFDWFDKENILYYIRPPAPSWILASALLGLVGSVLAGFRARLSRPRLLMCAFFGAFIGLPAIALIAIIAPPPFLQTCSTCDRRRNVTQSHCPTCRTAPPAPTPTGAEVIAPLH
jgi:hypothetical protein